MLLGQPGSFRTTFPKASVVNTTTQIAELPSDSANYPLSTAKFMEHSAFRKEHFAATSTFASIPFSCGFRRCAKESKTFQSSPTGSSVFSKPIWAASG